MIKPEEFYSKNEYPDFFAKKRMWRKISKNIRDAGRVPIINIDYRSFAFGFGAAFAVAFICIGMFTVLTKIMEREEPAYVKINNAYSKAIDEFEKSMPKYSTAAYKTYSLDEKINAKRNNLKNIDEGIQAIKLETGAGDISPVKQNRLLELYKMKLEILEKMIGMEEND